MYVPLLSLLLFLVIIRVCCLQFCLQFPCLPLLQGVDPSFLEELLRYLRQQRGQLDESQRLLETLEQQKQHRHGDDGTASRVAVETSQSGTIPSPSAAKGEGDGGRGRGRASRVDLKSLYNHCTFFLRLPSLRQQLLKIYTAFPLINSIAHAQHKMLNAQHQIYYYFLSHTHTHTPPLSLSLQW